MPVTDELRAVFSKAGVEGFVHAREIDSDRELGYRGDEPVVAASTFKVPVLVELFRQADAGVIDLTAQVEVPVADRAPGPTGASVMLDPVRASWRDLALWMIVVSDNAATDVICEKVGLDNVNQTMLGLGLTGTCVESDCRGIFATMTEDAGISSVDDFPRAPDGALLARLRAVHPETTDRTTPADMSHLLQLIYTDRAASPEACGHMRRILASQVWPHRFASGFPEEGIATAGKTGTIVLWRNEAGVATYPDGGRYAVAVYTRAPQARWKDPAADAAIGTAARLAVDALRSIPSQVREGFG